MTLTFATGHDWCPFSATGGPRSVWREYKIFKLSLWKRRRWRVFRFTLRDWRDSGILLWDSSVLELGNPKANSKKRIELTSCPPLLNIFLHERSSFRKRFCNTWKSREMHREYQYIFVASDLLTIETTFLKRSLQIFNVVHNHKRTMWLLWKCLPLTARPAQMTVW